jgi:hypothetical protein
VQQKEREIDEIREGYQELGEMMELVLKELRETR